MIHYHEITLLATEVEELSIEIELTNNQCHKNKLLKLQKGIICELENLINALRLRISSD